MNPIEPLLNIITDYIGNIQWEDQTTLTLEQSHIFLVNRIMRLANLIPSISTELVAHLNDIGIRTEIDLLFSATPLEILRHLPAGCTSLEELKSFIDLVTGLCAAPGMSALELVSLETRARTKDKELRSGNEQIDRLLCGLGGRKVIHVSGERGSGKSVGSWIKNRLADLIDCVDSGIESGLKPFNIL